MKNVVIISGLGGVGKTYLTNKILKSDLNNLFHIELRGTTQEDYRQVIEEVGSQDTLLLLEMHPPFDKLKDDMIDVNLIHIGISKDFETYKSELSQEKIKYLNDWFEKHNSKNFLNDIIEYNKSRFDYSNQMPRNSVIVSSINSGISKINQFCEKIRKKELFKFVHKNYNIMLYHSPDFDGIGYKGTSPSDEKFKALKLNELIPEGNNNTCLDVGCNIGYISYLLSHYFKSVDGIDNVEENIKCAKWLKQKFFRDKEIIFNQRDFMDCTLRYDYVFALAVLHHIAKKHKFEDVIKKLSDLTRIAAVVEINEIPRWTFVFKKYFKEIKVIGNSYLPVSKKIVKNRWIIHCIK